MGFMLMNIQANVLISVSADPGENYPYQPTDDVIMKALEYLRNRQAGDGSIGGFSVSAWAAMAISSAGEDSHAWGDLVGYLRENADRLDDTMATDWERQTLAIVACNENPRNFGDIDYVAKVESFYDGTQIGSYANLYDDFFGILALISGGVDKDSSIVQTVHSYIKEKQNENGGWGDVDSTAAAIMALIVAGEDPDSGCVTDALSFMKTTQTGSGGFQSWGTTNAASTAWAVDAIVSTGRDPTSDEWRNNGNSPIDFLLGLQQESGCFNWAVNQTMSPEWMTSYVIPALLGIPYPVRINESDGGTGDNNDGDDENGNNNGWAGYWMGSIRIEGKTDTIWNGEVTVSNSTITALNDSSGEMEDYYISYPSVLGALDEASQEGGFSYYVIYYPSWDAFYVKTIANDSDWWHYWVDYTLPMVGVGAYNLTEDNREILLGYLENWTACALRITAEKHTVNESEEFMVRVCNETMYPVRGAFVFVDSLVYNKTDTNGNAIIHIDTAGEYKIYAEKDGYVRSGKASVHVTAKKIVEIVKPADNAFYLWNRKTGIRIQKILIIGPIDIQVSTTDDVEKVEFYVGDMLKYVDTERPFTWRLNEQTFFKKEMIKVKAYTNDNDSIYKIQNLIRYIDSLPENHLSKTALNLIKSHLKRIELSLLGQIDIDEKEVFVFDLFPRAHIL
jgi:hypothetical protein